MNIEKEVGQIIQRNKKVESDKAWETSFTRRAIITIMTYLIIVLFLYIIKISSPWINALIPTIAFMLSTLTLPFFRKLWLNKK
jgi:ABC-type bacteriocin/lantibiotic exporter with double-glycine peptidase domain|tara:strand:+ start:219 stop:467 length:249 start_codon:yes stop_codon:yes gene_type:complete